jgi:hypothetical protein
MRRTVMVAAGLDNLSVPNEIAPLEQHLPLRTPSQVA